MSVGYSMSFSSCRACHHKARHRIDTLGKTRCEECPDEICAVRLETKEEGKEATPEAPIIRHMQKGGTLDTFDSPVGIHVIHEMTRGEMVAELLAFSARKMEDLSIEELRLAIARTRTHTTRNAIYAEAGVSEPNMWGWLFE